MSYTVFSVAPGGTVLHENRVMDAARQAVLRAIERDGHFGVKASDVRRAPKDGKRLAGWWFELTSVTKRSRIKWAALRKLIEKTLDRFEFDAVVWVDKKPAMPKLAPVRAASLDSLWRQESGNQEWKALWKDEQELLRAIEEDDARDARQQRAAGGS